MLYRKYNDFDEFFKSITPELLYNPTLLNFTSGRVGYVKNLIVDVDNTYCNLQLADLGYRIGKWKSLLNKYLDYGYWCEFKEKLKTVKGHSYTFYFNRNINHNNGSCINSMVFSRENTNGKWTSIHIEYRVTELQRKLMADLILFSKMVEDLPSDICDIKSVTMYFPVAYVSSMFINAFWEYFSIDINKLDTSNMFIFGLVDSKKKYFSEDSPDYKKFMSIYRLQKVYRGLENFDNIDNSLLTLNANDDIIINTNIETDFNKNVLW